MIAKLANCNLTSQMYIGIFTNTSLWSGRIFCENLIPTKKWSRGGVCACVSVGVCVRNREVTLVSEWKYMNQPRSAPVSDNGPGGSAAAKWQCLWVAFWLWLNNYRIHPSCRAGASAIYRKCVPLFWWAVAKWKMGCAKWVTTVTHVG